MVIITITGSMLRADMGFVILNDPKRCAKTSCVMQSLYLGTDIEVEVTRLILPY